MVDICARIGAQPDDLMACMAFESAGTFSPSIRNAAGSGAVGLIQFMPETAMGLKTDTASLAAMTAERQLDYVGKYFDGKRGRGSLRTIEDLYMAILWPPGIGKAPSYVIFTSPSIYYRQNAGLDLDRDGKVTKFEAAARVRAMRTRGLGYIA